MSVKSPKPRLSRRFLAISAGVAILATPALASADEPGWSSTGQALETGVQQGYQLAMDDVNRIVYSSDAYWRRENKVPVYDTTGTEVGYTIQALPGTGKLARFDVARRFRLTDISYLGLTRLKPLGTEPTSKESDPLDWTGATGSSVSSIRTNVSPYGVAVDPLTPGGPTVITTAARQSAVVVYKAADGPKDADVIWRTEGGADYFNGLRRVAVNTKTHKAYLTNFGDSRGATPGTTFPGNITVVDLVTKKVEARVTVPGFKGAIGVDVDEEHNRVYVGAMTGENLSVIDASKIKTTDPESFTLNDDAITELPAVVGANARPTYSPELKRVYVSAYNDQTITAVEADPASAQYGQVIAQWVAGDTNANEVDGERGLLYSANLKDNEVKVYSTDDHRELLTIPTSGQALNIAIDPVTRDAWVSNFSAAAKVDILSVSAPAPAPAPAPTPQPAPTPAPTPDAPKAAPKKVTLSSIAQLKKGKSVRVKAPAAGRIVAQVKVGKRVVAQRAVKVNKAKTVTLTLKRTAYGTKLAKQRASTKATLTVRFTPAKASDFTSAVRVVKATFRR